MKISAFWKIIRPLNTGITFLVVLLLVFALNPAIAWNVSVLAAVSAGLTAAAGNIINDIYDIEIDRINRPERVLVSGGISKTAAWISYIILIAASLLLSGLISPRAAGIVIITHLLLFLYSFKLKRVILLGNILVAGLTGLACVYAGVVAGFLQSSFLFAGFAFLINLIREVVKDIEDREGDVQNGVITFVSKYGIGKTRSLIKYLAIILIFLTGPPVVMHILKIDFFIIIMIFVIPVLVFVLKLLREDDYELKLRKMGNLLKFCMVAGLLAIYFGIPR